ncbi:MAG: transporter [Burkholderiaceae bacterium]|nr:transporter [Burkholderiaceae bacterium]
MNLLLELLARQEILLLCLLVGLGSLLGHVRLAGVSLGAAAVLFLAIGLSAWGHAAGHALVVSEHLGVLGLILFTFSVGMMSGANFFATLRQGLGPILAVVGVLMLAAGVAVAGGRLLGLDPATVAGAFAGALTNTPALAAAKEATGQSPLPTIGYAVTYVFGVVGMLAVATLALKHRAQDADAPTPLVNCTVRVETRQRPGIRELEQRHGERIKFSRVRHGGMRFPVQAVHEDDVLTYNDLVTVVGPADEVEQVVKELGHASSHALEADRSALDFRRITLSNGKLAGRTVAELELLQRFGATVSRVRRGDVDMLGSDHLVLQLGDRLRVVAPREQIGPVTAYLGDSARGLSDIHPMVLGLGLAAGILLGRIAVPLPGGGSFALGSAAGTLLVGLLLGHLGRIGRFVTTMPLTAAQALSELGLLIFLAQAGTKAGGQIGSAFATGEWWRILLLGAAITLTAGLGVYLVMRRAFGMGGTKLSGVLAGTQTQPAVLAFANGRTRFDARVAMGYALVYPAAMITKILLGQILGGL